MKSLCKGVCVWMGWRRTEHEKARATECTTGCSYSPLIMLQADLAKNPAPGCWGLALALWSEHAGCTSNAKKRGFLSSSK
ncbi:uncharacterized [Tachysurus ichikawai]